MSRSPSNPRLLAAAVVFALGSAVAVPATGQLDEFLVVECKAIVGDCKIEIPEFDPSILGQQGVSVSMDVPASACDTAIAVAARLQIDHNWVGDLRVALTQESSGRTVILLDRPGVDQLGDYGCPGIGLDVRLHDGAESRGSADDICAVTIPAISGDRTTTSLADGDAGLPLFAGTPCAGAWTLTVSDLAAPNDGVLLDWSLLLLPQATPTPASTSTASQPPATATPPPATPTAPTGAPSIPPSTPVPPTNTPGGPTITPTPSGAPCVGDCNGSGEVTINELVLGVRIALGDDTVGSCPAFDPNLSGGVEITELIAAVNNALNGCP